MADFNPLKEAFKMFDGIFTEKSHQKYFVGLTLAFTTVFMLFLFSQIALPAMTTGWAWIRQSLEYLLGIGWLPRLVKGMLLCSVSLMDIISWFASNLGNVAVFAELFLMEFHRFGQGNLVYICTRYRYELDMASRCVIWCCTYVNAIFRDIRLRSMDPESRTPNSLLLIFFTVVKCAINIDNELEIAGENPGGPWHGQVAFIVGPCMVLDMLLTNYGSIMSCFYRLLQLPLITLICILTGIILHCLANKAMGMKDSLEQSLHRHIHFAYVISTMDLGSYHFLVPVASIFVIGTFLIIHAK